MQICVGNLFTRYPVESLKIKIHRVLSIHLQLRKCRRDTYRYLRQEYDKPSEMVTNSSFENCMYTYARPV